MKSSLLLALAMAAFSSAQILVERSPVGERILKTKFKRGIECSREAIADCVADTGLDYWLCYARGCAGWEGDEAELKMLRKRQTSMPPTCTEEALNECAINEWRDPDVCFEQLCIQ